MCSWRHRGQVRQDSIHFVSDEMLQETAEQTLLYSVQKEGKPVNAGAKEIKQVSGMYLHTGLVQMFSVRAELSWGVETKLTAVSLWMWEGLTILQQLSRDACSAHEIPIDTSTMGGHFFAWTRNWFSIYHKAKYKGCKKCYLKMKKQEKLTDMFYLSKSRVHKFFVSKFNIVARKSCKIYQYQM